MGGCASSESLADINKAASHAGIVLIRTRLPNTSFMFLVSVTVVAAFHAASAILVIAPVVVPAATAHLISRRLSVMLVLTALFAVVGAFGGFWIAYALNAATSAGMAVFYGLLFIVVAFIDSLATQVRRYRRRSVSLPAARHKPVSAQAVAPAGAPTDPRRAVTEHRPMARSFANE